jgi:Zinc finger, C3HC4 type (RING finger)
VEHKRLAQTECSYLEMNEETVKLNEQKLEEFKKLETKDGNSCNDSDGIKAESSIDFESLCKICLERKSSVIFMPCRHVAVCGQCSFGVDSNCPICRTHISEKIHLYYA